MKHLVFVDAQLADRTTLLETVRASAQIVHISDTEDAVAAMTAAIIRHTELDALHLLCHGRPGALQIGANELSEQTLLAAAESLRTLWRQHLGADAEILLYGCDLAADTAGIEFMHTLSRLSGARVMASSSKVGAKHLGASWELDTLTHAGRAPSFSVASEQYAHTLAIVVGGPGDDSIDGTAASDTLTGGGGDDWINGLAGIDVASFAGKSLHARFGWDSGWLTVEDKRPVDGDDGFDQLRGIEILHFDGDNKDFGFVVPGVEGSVLGEFRVNTHTQGGQQAASVTNLADGGWLVTWASYGQDGNYWGVYAQRYDADGVAAGGEFRINETDYSTATLSNLFEPQVAGLEDGGFVVTWSAYGQDGDGYGIVARVFDEDGQPRSAEFIVNSVGASSQVEPSVAALASGGNGDGGFVITFTSYGQDGSSDGVFGRRFDADGNTVGDEFQVNAESSGRQSGAQVAATADGGFVVAWQSAKQDGSSWGVFARVYDAAGDTSGADIPVNTTTNLAQNEASLAVLGDGSWVVAWRSDGQDGSESGVYARHFTASGTALSAEFIVNTTTDGIQAQPAVAALDAGGFVISWSSYLQDGSHYGVFAQRFDDAGNALGNEFQVNSYAESRQWQSSVAALDDGGFVTAWTSFGQDGSSEGVYAKRYDADGNPLLAELVGTEGNDRIDISGTGDLRARGLGGNDTYIVDSLGDQVIEGENGGTDRIMSYVNYALPGNGNVENLTLLGDATSGTGNSDDNMIIGNELDNVLKGLGGNDLLVGEFGNDSLLGGDGEDTLYGDAGADTMDGGVDSDVMVGGYGDDLYYVDDPGDLVIEYGVSLTVPNGLLSIDGWEQFGWQENEAQADAGSNIDTVISQINYTLTQNVENLQLANDAADLAGAGNDLPNTLTGDNGKNRIEGKGGDDVIRGAGANDSLYGDDGNDTLNGGAGFDYIEGGLGIDLLVGDIGNDTLVGGGWSDTLRGDGGNDSLDGGSGFDLLRGMEGNDILTGGPDRDDFYFETALSESTNLDHITDFDPSADFIRLQDSVFLAFQGRGTGQGLVAAGELYEAANVTATSNTGALLLYNTSTGYLYYDADGAGSAPGVAFAVLDTKPDISVDDFIII